jgi:hypothetical protein
VTAAPDKQGPLLEALATSNPELSACVGVLLEGEDWKEQYRASRRIAKMKPAEGNPAVPVLTWHLDRVTTANPQGVPVPRSWREKLATADINALVTVAPDEWTTAGVLCPLCAYRLGEHDEPDPSDVIDPGAGIRRAALRACRKVGKAHSKHRRLLLSGLVRLLLHKSPLAASSYPQALATLGEFGADARATLPILRKLTASKDQAVRKAARDAVKAIEGASK